MEEVLGVEQLPVEPTDTASSGINILSWFIVSFSEDIIGEIASYGGLEAVILLWTSGDSILRHKLSSPRCRVGIWHKQRMQRRFIRFPTFLGEMKGITSVSFCHENVARSADANHFLNWQVLPQSVEHVDYIFDPARANYFSNLGQLFPKLNSLAVISVSGAGPIFPRNISSNLQLLGLRFLSLSGVELTPDQCKDLPSTLESLYLPGLYGTCNASLFAPLTCLQTLSIPFISIIAVVCRPTGVDSFPPSLTSLNIDYCTSTINHEQRRSATTMDQQTKSNLILRFFEPLTLLKHLRVHSALLMSMHTPTTGDVSTLPSFWTELLTLEVNNPVNRAFPLPVNLTQLKLSIPTLAYPDRLPRTIRKLNLPGCSIALQALPQLPPKLSVIIFGDIIKSFGDDDSHIAFPSSVTSVTLAGDLERSGLETTPKSVEILLDDLPKTVMSFCSARIDHVRVPEALLELCPSARIGTSNWVSHYSCIVANNVKLLEYTETFTKALLRKTPWDAQLQVAIKNSAFESLLWLLQKRKATHISADAHYHECGGLLLSIVKMPGVSIQQHLHIFRAFIEYGINPSQLSSNRLLISVVDLGNLELLNLLEQAGVNSWDGQQDLMTPLTRAIYLCGKSSPVVESTAHSESIVRTEDESFKILDWLLDRGARSVHIKHILARSMSEKTLVYLELLKATSNKWEIGFLEDPIKSSSGLMDDCEDFRFVTTVLEWLIDPANAVNIVVETGKNTDLRHLFSALFLRFSSLLIPHKMLEYRDQSTVTTPNRSLQRPGLNAETFLSLCRWFSEKGVDITTASLGNPEHDSLYELLIALDSIELFEFVASLPDGTNKMTFYWAEIVVSHNHEFQTAGIFSPGTRLSYATREATTKGCCTAVVDFMKSINPEQLKETNLPRKSSLSPSARPTPLQFHHFKKTILATPKTSIEYGISSLERDIAELAPRSSSEIPKPANLPPKATKRAKPVPPSQRSASSAKTTSTFGTASFSASSSLEPNATATFGKGTAFVFTSKFGSRAPQPLNSAPKDNSIKPQISSGGFGATSSAGKTTFGSGTSFGKGTTFGTKSPPP